MKSVAALLTFASLLTAATTVARAAEIDAIAAYDGTWKTHIVHVKSALGPAFTEDATLHNVCRHTAGYYACEQIVDGVTKVLLVFTYDPKQKQYASHVFPAVANEDMGSGTLLINGNVWTFPWRQTIDGKQADVRIVNTFTNPDTIEVREEFSFDNQTWTVALTGTEHRIK